MSKDSKAVEVYSMQAPAFLAAKTGPARGMEEVTASDIIIPSIELIQALSPVRDKKDPSYIEGAEEGMMYNNVTKALYGSEVLVVPVVYRKQWLIWKDRKMVGGANGFRGAFSTELEAKKHIAGLGEEGLDTVETAQHFCLVVNGNDVEEAVVSMGKTKLKVSRRWNSLMRLAGGDSFERIYKLAPVVEVNSRNEKYYNFGISSVGYVTANLFARAEALYEQVSQGQVVASQDFEAPAGVAENEF